MSTAPRCNETVHICVTTVCFCTGATSITKETITFEESYSRGARVTSDSIVFLREEKSKCWALLPERRVPPPARDPVGQPSPTLTLLTPTGSVSPRARRGVGALMGSGRSAAPAWLLPGPRRFQGGGRSGSRR